MNADTTGPSTSSGQTHCMDMLWLGSVFWGGSNSSSCFPLPLQGLLLIRCASLSVIILLYSPHSPSSELTGQGGTVHTDHREYGCRVHPLRLSMSSSGVI